MFDPSPKSGSSSFTRKNGLRTFVANRLSKSSIVCSSIGAAFETPALATKMSSRWPTIAQDLLCERGGPVRCREIRLRCIRRPTCRANSGYNCVRLRGRAAKVNDDVCPLRGKGSSRARDRCRARLP